MRASQAVLLRRIRRLTVLLAVAGVAYLVMRFDIVGLPEDRCCPLTRFEPGDRLIVDGSPTTLSPADAVLVRTADGSLHLTRISAVRSKDGAIWCETDAPDCPGLSSEDVGWIDPRAVDGRVLMSWEF
ncbi:MAG: hypothetical protein AAF602_31270 [Myxococcota bacterium]